MLVLALAFVQPVAAQTFKPDYQAGQAALSIKDYATALRHWRPLAERGDTWAQNKLGAMYRRGWGATKDYKEAVKWYRKAAEQGYNIAQDYLGSMYQVGKGVVQDPVMAYVWFSVSAANGINAAIRNRDKILARLNASERRLATKLSRLCLKKPKSCPVYSE